MIRSKTLLVIIISTLFIISSAWASGDNISFSKATDFRLASDNNNRYYNELDEDTLIYFEDFEGDNVLEEWESFNYNPADPSAWHTDTWNAFEDGTSWWCGTDDVEGEGVYGYDNAWLQYLDTPVLDFSNAVDNLTLDFVLQHGSEAGIPGPNYEGFDGWDGGSVFISLDNGVTWEVLENPSYEYNAESLYAFFSRGVGDSIAGWRDVSEGWVECSYDLSGYIEEATVTIRFAFASDNGVNTTSNEDWFGFFVDEIEIYDDDVTYLENNAEGVADPEDLIPVPLEGTDVTWELQEDEYFSETHAWGCENGLNVFSVLISPDIQLLDGWRHFLTYYVYCDYPDDDGDSTGTLEDYYQIQISNDGGEHWETFGHDYGYNGSDQGWVLRENILVQGQNQATEEIMEIPPEYAGGQVSFRFRAITDGDHNGGEGTGVFIDDISVIANSGWEHDIGVEEVFIPFPTTVDYLVPAWAQFRNYGNNQEEFSALWRLGNDPEALLNNYAIEPGDSVRVWLDNNDEDGLDGWMPVVPGTFPLYVQRLLFDDYPDNDTSRTYLVDVLPAGEYELGYDDRFYEFTTTRFDAGEGPATHFFIPEDLDNFNIEMVRVMWNGNMGLEGIDAADFTLHIFGGGETFGEELYSGTFTATPDITIPNVHELDLGVNEALMGLSGDFWVWFELNHIEDDRLWPEPVFSEENVGEGFHYDYDGSSLSNSYADWMIRVVGTYEVEDGVDGTELTAVPAKFALHEAYPNPFNPSTNISFDVAKHSYVNLTVYNINGQEVAWVVNRDFAPGSYNVTWDASSLSSGIYFVKMNAGSFNDVNKVMLLK